MMEQVMINLLKNAIETFDNFPDSHILVISYRDYEGRDVIEIADNGSGTKVYLKFYTPN